MAIVTWQWIFPVKERTSKSSIVFNQHSKCPGGSVISTPDFGLRSMKSLVWITMVVEFSCTILHCRQPFIITLQLSQYDLNNVERVVKHRNYHLTSVPDQMVIDIKTILALNENMILPKSSFLGQFLRDTTFPHPLITDAQKYFKNVCSTLKDKISFSQSFRKKNTRIPRKASSHLLAQKSQEPQSECGY